MSRARYALPIIVTCFFCLWGSKQALAASSMTAFQRNQANELYPVVSVQSELVTLRSGPGQAYPVLAQAPNGTQFSISGHSLDGAWVQICCINGTVGWLEATALQTVQTTVTAVPTETTPTPTPTVDATPFYGWKSSYFANPVLSGEPVQIEDIAELTLDWEDRAPRAEMPADGFSVRFERNLALPGGYYRFWLQADDGVRLWINDALVLDEWHGSTGTTYQVERRLTGSTKLRLDYFEASGAAYIHFGYTFMGDGNTWEATYYGAALQGNPWLTQSEPQVGNYSLERSQPLGATGSTAWSARWRGHFTFAPGNYLFHARANGAVRVYLNEYLVLDGWTGGTKEIANWFVGVGGETHTIVVEYSSDQPIGALQIWWERQ